MLTMKYVSEMYQGILSKLSNVLSRLELALKKGKGLEHAYILEKVESVAEEGVLKTLVFYRVLGGRKQLRLSASELNQSGQFSLFRPDHAQMIISLATIEAVSLLSIEEIHKKHDRYVRRCNLMLEDESCKFI